MPKTSVYARRKAGRKAGPSMKWTLDSFTPSWSCSSSVMSTLWTRAPSHPMVEARVALMSSTVRSLTAVLAALPFFAAGAEVRGRVDWTNALLKATIAALWTVEVVLVDAVVVTVATLGRRWGTDWVSAFFAFTAALPFWASAFDTTRVKPLSVFDSTVSTAVSDPKGIEILFGFLERIETARLDVIR